MEEKISFSGLKPYKLTNVKVTDGEPLGHGSYATVLELEYMGLKCAGKKIHKALQDQGDSLSYATERFETECHLLSQICHPNIVQFLGVYFQQEAQVPILVMELLHTNLTTCIDQYGILPKEISYSILYDVALGLCYLHSQTPPIIHRDLSSNNILLTTNMTAKISDLGVAKILNLNPLQVSRMTGTPGTPAYMPPEVMVANPKYDTSVDEFSYGILIIHMHSGQWPVPQVEPNIKEGEKFIPVTEAERREPFLQIIGKDHPLMDLILKCLDNDPKGRARSTEIVAKLANMVSQFPPSFVNRFEMLKRIEADEEKLQQREKQMLNWKKEAEKKTEEIHQLNVTHSSEVEQLKLKLRDTVSQNELFVEETEAELVELRSKITLYEAQMVNKDRIEQETEQSDVQLKEEKETIDEPVAQENGESAVRLSRMFTKKLQSLQSEVSRTRTKANALQHRYESDIAIRDGAIKRSQTELKARARVLQEKDSIISGMSEQLTKAREHLATKKQVLQTKITWNDCAALPAKLYGGTSVVINGKVYCSGGNAVTEDDKYYVYCYDLSLDQWITLPPPPLKWFSLGQVNGKLVAVGGQENTTGRGGARKSEKCHKGCIYDEREQKWKRTIPPLPTARNSPRVLSLQSALVVAGGYTQSTCCTGTVEIYKPEAGQWFTTDPLPAECTAISIVAIDKTCYVLGALECPSYLNQAYYASLDDLLLNAVPANQTTSSDSSETRHPSAWSSLPNTPTYRPAAAMLAGNLLAIGGNETYNWGSADKKEVYIYSPSINSWIYVSDLPAPRSRTVVASLSSTEMLVIGGRGGGSKVNTVYKGTLHLKV